MFIGSRDYRYLSLLVFVFQMRNRGFEPPVQSWQDCVLCQTTLLPRRPLRSGRGYRTPVSATTRQRLNHWTIPDALSEESFANPTSDLRLLSWDYRYLNVSVHQKPNLGIEPSVSPIPKECPTVGTCQALSRTSGVRPATLLFRTSRIR